MLVVVRIPGFSYEQAGGVEGVEFSAAEILFYGGKTIVFLYDYKQAAESIEIIKSNKIFNVRLSEEVSMDDNVTVSFLVCF